MAVSGGPDSVALVHALHHLSESGKLSCQFHVAHFNHHLRGEASQGDEAVVRELTATLKLPFLLGESHELTPDQSHLEASARKLRYRWLTDTALSLGCTAIVTGHTLNDQAETVLHHLIRGTGWRGLRGIAPVRRLREGIVLLRPLLRCTRQQVLDYVAEHNLAPRHDASNDDPRFTRNRLRHQVLPRLMASYPQALQHLAGWATTARKHYAQLTASARDVYPSLLAHAEDQQLALFRPPLNTINDDVLQEVLRRVWRLQRWPVDQMNARRWREAIEVCRGSRTAVELPGRIMVRSKELVIQFIRQ